VRKRPLFLLTNDDGVHADGIKALADAVSGLGDVWIAAPHAERSAASQAISIAGPIRFEEIRSRVFAVEGTPADCVMVGCLKLLPRRPDWVISGINRGGNLALDTQYSGTVGAAREGRMHGARAMAVSAYGSSEFHYVTAGRVVRWLMERESLLETGPFGILNVNVPNLPFESLSGIAFPRLGRRKDEHMLQDGADPRGRPYVWIGSPVDAYEDIPESDCMMIARGFVTLSVLRVDPFDEVATRRLQDNLPKGFRQDESKGG
jgi:5'-nucleotidase